MRCSDEARPPGRLVQGYRADAGVSKGGRAAQGPGSCEEGGLAMVVSIRQGARCRRRLWPGLIRVDERLQADRTHDDRLARGQSCSRADHDRQRIERLHDRRLVERVDLRIGRIGDLVHEICGDTLTTSWYR